MSITEVVVCSLGDLIDKVTPTQPDVRTGRRRDTGVYRGASDARRPLLTSLDRLGGANPPHTKRELEAHILRNFKRYSRPHLPTAPVNDWETLVAAQHHGVPTRLLDWTYSPLVAAHFATTDVHAGRDRAVWRLDWQQVHRAFKLPTLAFLIEDLARTFGSDEHPFTPWSLFDAASGSGRSARTDIRDFACMIEPPSLDARIIAQAAVFTLCTDTSRAFDDFLESHGLAMTLTKFVIPESEATRVRDQLDLVGIDERRVFPDLDGVAEGLRRYYS
jgi:FRG domain